MHAQARGGRRAGAGRKSAFPGKGKKAFAMDFTPAGRVALDVIIRRTRLSRNDVIAHLVIEHAAALTFEGDGVEFPDKAQQVLSIRLPDEVGAALVAARARTGKSYSDIGEALVRRYGREAIFPARAA